jgi:HD superfamily phosphohydrolase
MLYFIISPKNSSVAQIFLFYLPKVTHSIPKYFPMSANAFKKKIINDPVYGFITTPFSFCLEVLDHPWFQRLRRIKQLGLSHLVYPGALHTRFHHALGAMHLMTEALDSLRGKGIEISENEYEGAVLAILLHDIGHGPFSHALENTILKNVHHEHLSLEAMNRLNKHFDGKLSTAIDIFIGTHTKKFLHQLVSSQLDMDRLDYLKRDSFFTGVSEGVVSSTRIIKMLNVHQNELVLEEKGIYSIEKFIVARRLMYWQVYLHKTVVSAEFMLVHLLNRAKKLLVDGYPLACAEPLYFFLKNDINLQQLFKDKSIFDKIMQLDDGDIDAAIKLWQYEEDTVLSYLATGILQRKLHKVKVLKQPASEELLNDVVQKTAKHFGIKINDAQDLIVHEMMANQAYTKNQSQLKLLQKNNEIAPLEELADNLNLPVLSQPVKKFFLAYPRELSEIVDF